MKRWAYPGGTHLLERLMSSSPSQMTETQGDTRRRRSLSGRVSAGVLYIALVGPPFLFGSREPIFVAWWCAILGTGLIFAPTRRLLAGHLVVLAVLGFVALCFGFVLHEQLSDHPWIADFNPIWAAASEALGRQLTPSVSAVRGQPFFALGPSLANTLALVLGLLVGGDADRAQRAVRIMAWAGVVYAIYGVLALEFDPNAVLWREKTAYVGSLTSTFINRNTAAVYFGSCAAVWLVLLMSAIRGSLPRGPIEWKNVPGHFAVGAPKRVLVRFAMLFVCLSAMFLTSSRGGTLVSLTVLVVSFLLYFRRDLPRGKGFVIALAGAAMAALLVLQLLGGNIGDRIDMEGLSDRGRLAAYHSTLKIIADYPWFGTGLGTFADVFPRYRSSAISMAGVWDIAHDTPLEFASEMGIPLTIVVAAAWIAALVVLSLAVRGSRREMVVPLSSLAVSLIALVHSLIDFSLQITGYSIVIFALLGVGLSQAIRGRKGSGEGSISVNLNWPK
jgi:O-antigen ligase/polysaccharide polymerase Wzy-like membrane protein